MMGPIKFLFLRAARDYADYRIIAAEKAQAELTSELAVARTALAETTAEKMDFQRRYVDLLNRKYPVSAVDAGLRTPEVGGLNEGVGA